MKILYIYQYFGTNKGSWSSRSHEMCKRWVTAGHKVTIVTTIYDKSDLKQHSFCRQHNIDGIEVIAFNILMSNKDPFWKRIQHFLSFSIAALWIPLSNNYDVTIASSGPITVGPLGLAAKFVKNSRFLFEVRDLWPEGAIELGILKSPLLRLASYRLAKTCYAHSDGIIALSKGIKEWIQRNYRHSPIHVAPNASDNDFFSSHSNTNSAHGVRDTILYAGTLGKMDGCHEIIDAARFAQDNGYHHLKFLLLGDGNEREALEKRATGLTNLRFGGLKAKKDVARALSISLCSVYTIANHHVLTTGSPNKMFDSFAAGIPIIHNSGGWIKKLTQSEKCGLYFEPGESQRLVEHADALYQSTAMHNEYSSNAKSVATNRFDRSKVASGMLNFMKRPTLKII